MNRKFFVLIIMLLISGCTSVAKVENFESDISKINFDQIEESHDSSSGDIWTWKGKNEYFFYVSNIEATELSQQLILTLEKNGYSVVKKSNDGSAIIGKRGLRANEWNSVAGIYFTPKSGEYRVYIKVEITQDITGGWNENRARKIGMDFCKNSGECKNL